MTSMVNSQYIYILYILFLLIWLLWLFLIFSLCFFSLNWVPFFHFLFEPLELANSPSGTRISERRKWNWTTGGFGDIANLEWSKKHPKSATSSSTRENSTTHSILIFQETTPFSGKSNLLTLIPCIYLRLLKIFEYTYICSIHLWNASSGISLNPTKPGSRFLTKCRVNSPHFSYSISKKKKTYS